MDSTPLLQTIGSPADLKQLSVDQLTDLAAEIRNAICEQVKKSGGHLAPNLGVVELTIALHYVFDFGHDRLLFDVQSMVTFRAAIVHIIDASLTTILRENRCVTFLGVTQG